MASLQAGLCTTSDAMGRAIRDVEEVRMWLERAVTFVDQLQLRIRCSTGCTAQSGR